MKDLSVIIVSYNTQEITQECVTKLIESIHQTPSLKAEIILIDNDSKDGSVEMIRKIERRGLGDGEIGRGGEGERKREGDYTVDVKTIFNNENVGFAKANNEGIAIANSKYILFLNSDAYVQDVNFEDLVYYMDKNPQVGVLTVKIILPDGTMDKASHRGFPTIWNSFTYFSKLEKVFTKFPKLSKYFGNYHLTHLDLNTIHEIDSPSGAFYLTRANILKETNGFDTAFFMYGEDLDLSYRIKEFGYKIIYYPLFRVIHLKKQSGLNKNRVGVQRRTSKHFYEAMQIFYDKHFAKNNSFIENIATHFFINLKSKIQK